MRENLSLNEGWRAGWCDFNGRPPNLGGTGPGREVFDATVPGDVHIDLVREGILPDLYMDRNLDHAGWVETKDWWYGRTFDSPAERVGRRVRLVFHGLDTFATIWLNGTELGRTDNMFRRYAFDVTALLRSEGPNELRVRLAAPRYAIVLDPDHAPLVWSPERLFVRKAQMSFGWDIAPRLVTAGIWRPVELELTNGAALANVHVDTVSVDGGRATVRVEAEVEWLAAEPGRVELRGELHGQSWVQVETCRPGSNRVEHTVVLDEAPLWWPVGYGEARRVDAAVVLCVAGRVTDEWREAVGLARVELVQESQSAGATGFRFRCNGRDVFITGLNWTPLDAVFARVTPEQVTRQLEALAGMGCNMLRVWGGGIYESPHFYAECDRLGILVWQDFMMSCGWYPQTDGFAAALEVEARQVVRDLRNHVCLAVWCGDNEVDMFYEDLAASNRLTRDVLPRVCAELDARRAYICSSPFSPSGARTASTTEGDSHCWGHGKAFDDPFFRDLRCRFLSEFGHLSLPSVETIRRSLPADAQWPLTTPAWLYHGANTIGSTMFRGPEKILEALEACGRAAPPDLAAAVAASQQLQADAVCDWIEYYCRDPEFGGFLLWNVGDCWPQQSDAVFDYQGHPKAVVARLGPLFRKVRAARALPGASAAG